MMSGNEQDNEEVVDPGFPKYTGVLPRTTYSMKEFLNEQRPPQEPKCMAAPERPATALNRSRTIRTNLKRKLSSNWTSSAPKLMSTNFSKNHDVVSLKDQPQQHALNQQKSPEPEVIDLTRENDHEEPLSSNQAPGHSPRQHVLVFSHRNSPGSTHIPYTPFVFGDLINQRYLIICRLLPAGNDWAWLVADRMHRNFTILGCNRLEKFEKLHKKPLTGEQDVLEVRSMYGPLVLHRLKNQTMRYSPKQCVIARISQLETGGQRLISKPPLGSKTIRIGDEELKRILRVTLQYDESLLRIPAEGRKLRIPILTAIQKVCRYNTTRMLQGPGSCYVSKGKVIKASADTQSAKKSNTLDGVPAFQQGLNTVGKAQPSFVGHSNQLIKCSELGLGTQNHLLAAENQVVGHSENNRLSIVTLNKPTPGEPAPVATNRLVQNEANDADNDDRENEEGEDKKKGWEGKEEEEEEGNDKDGNDDEKEKEEDDEDGDEGEEWDDEEEEDEEQDEEDEEQDEEDEEQDEEDEEQDEEDEEQDEEEEEEKEEQDKDEEEEDGDECEEKGNEREENEEDEKEKEDDDTVKGDEMENEYDDEEDDDCANNDTNNNNHTNDSIFEDIINANSSENGGSFPELLGNMDPDEVLKILFDMIH